MSVVHFKHVLPDCIEHQIGLNPNSTRWAVDKCQNENATQSQTSRHVLMQLLVSILSASLTVEPDLSVDGLFG